MYVCLGSCHTCQLCEPAQCSTQQPGERRPWWGLAATRVAAWPGRDVWVEGQIKAAQAQVALCMHQSSQDTTHRVGRMSLVGAQSASTS